MIESLESRTLLSESASAQLSLVSTTGTQASPVYNYDIKVTDTGTTNIGTFWFSWMPGEDFLPSVPSATSNPTGWSSSITGSGNNLDGSAIEWVASSHQITPGNSLSGFNFTSTDSPSALAGTSPTHPGTPVLTAFVYAGAAFSDAGFQFTVNPAVTTAASSTIVGSSAPSVTIGNSVTFTATVAPSTGSGPEPTGTVTFLENGNALGTKTLSNGTASLATSSLPAGSLNITAVYNGDSAYSTSTSPPITQVVNPLVTTSTTLSSSAPAAVIGTPVTLTATITPATPGAAPTGTVSFTQDGNALGLASVQPDGTAALQTSTLPIGTDHITATYSGNATYSGSASAAFTQLVSPPANAVATTTILSSSALSAVPGVSITITATIMPATPGAVPTGTVVFTQAGTELGSSAVQNDGTAVLTTVSLPTGSDPIVASYSGDANYAASTSPTLTETIAAPPTLPPTVVKSTLPTALVSSIAAKGTVTVDFTNQTALTIKGKAIVAIYASTTGSIDGSAILLAQLPKKLNLKAGKLMAVTVSMKLAAGKLPPGSYTLVARVTDPSANVSDSTQGPAVTVAVPLIALSESLVKSTIPASLISGAKTKPATVILDITNNGNITTAGTTIVTIYATVDGTVDGTAIAINHVMARLRIRANKSGKVSVRAKQLSAIAAGTYTIVAQVTDQNGQLTTVPVGTIAISA